MGKKKWTSFTNEVFLTSSCKGRWLCRIGSKYFGTKLCITSVERKLFQQRNANELENEWKTQQTRRNEAHDTYPFETRNIFVFSRYFSAIIWTKQSEINIVLPSNQTCISYTSVVAVTPTILVISKSKLAVLSLFAVGLPVRLFRNACTRRKWNSDV